MRQRRTRICSSAWLDGGERRRIATADANRSMSEMCSDSVATCVCMWAEPDDGCCFQAQSETAAVLKGVLMRLPISDTCFGSDVQRMATDACCFII